MDQIARYNQWIELVKMGIHTASQHLEGSPRRKIVRSINVLEVAMLHITPEALPIQVDVARLAKDFVLWQYDYTGPPAWILN